MPEIDEIVELALLAGGLSGFILGIIVQSIVDAGSRYRSARRQVAYKALRRFK